MKIKLFTAIFCLLSFWMNAQTEPIALDYAIGAFKIPANLDRKISERFENLNPNQTYKVTIVGSADFLGSEDNNQVLSNKRVKFAEYHLLKKYRNLRLVIKLDSKGELYADERAKSAKGVQAHRKVYIYIEDYVRSPISAPVAANNSARNTDEFNGRTIATASAAQAEGIYDIPVSVSPNTTKAINPVSETALIEIEKQKQRAAIENELSTSEQRDNGAIQNDDMVTSASTTSTPRSSEVSTVSPESAVAGTLNVDGPQKPEKFDENGTFTVGETLLLSDLNFRPGSHYLRPSSIPSLRKLIDVLQANPTLEIEIIGHICCHPEYSPHPDGYDREAGDNKLSYNRANNIVEYLQKNGVDSSRLKATGMGARKRLVFPEETDADRITNRRVEIKIISL